MPIQCDKCSTQNRDIAKYCKICGQPILSESTSLLEDMIGLGEVKNEIKSLINITKAMQKRQGGSAFKINLHSIIIGNAGTGKSALVKILEQLYFQNGITTKPTAEIIDAVDYPAYSQKLSQNLPNLKGGILFIDNAQKLIPGGFASDINQLDKLFSEMDKFGFDPIVILAGLPKGFEEFLEKNPSVKNRFKYLFKLPDYSSNELYQISVNKLKSYSLTLNDDSEKRLKSLFKQAVKTKNESFGNAHLASNTAENIFKSYLARIGKGANDDNIVSVDDIHGDIPVERSLDQIMTELDEFIGMDNVKTAVKEIAKQVQMQQERALRGLSDDEKFGIHIVLTGNPGTGKTTIARKLGDIFAAIAYLDSGHVIETDRSQLVGQYQGETPKIVTEAINKAMGGILFVDEAYALAPQSGDGSKDKYGTEAIETLMKRMEDDRGKFVMIAAGYQLEMENFLNSNPGMKSRFNKYLHINDYNPDELLKIYKGFIKKKKYVLSPEAEEIAKKAIKAIHDSRDKYFGNGREMRKLFEDTVTKFSDRLGKLGPSSITDDSVYTTVQPEDIPFTAKKELSVEEVMVDLNKLTGMKTIKDEVKNLVDYLNFEKKRAEAGGKETQLSLHFVFTGDPGTGKTTVARLMGKIFSSLGLLPRGHLIEADRSKLVAGYSGQTAIKTNQLIDSAMGGLLFIDEAYTLSSGDSSFGKEAIDTLLKRMEDDRGKFVVIVAGYTQQMKDFLETNPGLLSRFTKTIHFDDYNGKEMAQIYEKLVTEKDMLLEGEAASNLVEYFEELYDKRDKNFGNAREVRNIFESSLQKQSARLSKLNVDELNDKDLNTITKDDLGINIKKKKTIPEILTELDEFIGMDNVKAAVREIAQQIQVQQERFKRGLGDKESLGIHFILTGNPGTGKTTISRKLGEIFKAVDFLSKGHVIETDRSSLVGQYIGQTPKLVNEQIEKAMGGILFIDEAYTLAASSSGSTDAFGKEAIETLMKRMEDDRGKYVVIAAGYQQEMDRFLNTNPGMKSRFNKYLHIEDYKPAELVRIYKQFLSKRKFILHPDTDDILAKAIKAIYDGRDKNFANAREMRKLFEDTINRFSDRIGKLKPEEITDNNVFVTILPQDIPFDKKKEINIDDVISELNQLTGMKNIKEEVRSLVDFLNVEKIRSESGGKETQLNLHFIFTGNPGTGKTTVARLMGKIFKGLDLLPRGHVVEADRSKLVAQYIGQTSIKTNDLIDQAMGGILFIDEAYTLSVGGQGDFGKEAIDTLLKRLEDDRGKFVCVIAGYTDQMHDFIQTNPGLTSRFTKKIHFVDYNGEEMTEIFVKMINNKSMKINPETEEWIRNYFDQLYENRDKNFGNARTVRNIFESALQKQSSRVTVLVKSGITDPAIINTLIKEDIES
ncbi:MAG: AAA family ATPase [Ignavibacteria bacterium]|nr:AAA family ATPase [Ignavibacteria bacterium]